MPLSPGTTLGSYEVLESLGAGGMGEVYRARDTKLKRDVAIKVLPDAFSRDPDRVSRFQREAEALAALNHQNIAAIYDLHQSGDTRFLVLELVEGDTLADVIRQRGALPFDEACHIARQICEALEAAHDKGIVHRDLKPANVKIMADGRVKVLDFGLAKALAPVGDDSGVQGSTAANSPTVSLTETSAGVILGTAAYMSPEQAKGRVVDRRSDIFAFGCVFYEMLTGRKAFDGDDIQEIIGAILKSEPDWNRLPPAATPSIRRMLRRALKKDARQRLGDIRDARFDIEEAGSETETPAPVTVPPPSRRVGWILSLAAVVVVAAGLAIPAWRHLNETPPAELRVDVTTPATPAPMEFALSPDGRHLVFVASPDGPRRLWLRALDETESHPMVGTDDAWLPFWSSDSKSVGFFAPGKLMRVDLNGAAPQMLTIVVGGRGGSWHGDTILFCGSSTAVLRIPASGGAEPTIAAKLDPPKLTSFRFPQFLPDGRHFVFFASAGSPEAQGLYLGSLDAGEPKRLTAADSTGAFVKPDRLAFVRQGALVSRRLDIARAELTGEPVVIADSVGYDASTVVYGFSISTAGQVAYRTGGTGRAHLTWFDRMGKVIGVAGDPDANAMLFPQLSPDGRRVAVTRTVQGNQDVYVIDPMRGGFTRFTTDAASELDAVWSPDGARIAFASSRTGVYDIYVRPSGSVGAEEVLVTSPNAKLAQDWWKSVFLYYEIDPKTARDLWAVNVSAKDKQPRVVANSPFDELMGQFSPDGRWVAYQTNETGRSEVVVRGFPESSRIWPVSTNGGIEPRWRVDGGELYFIAPDSKLMAVSVHGAGSTFEAGKPTALFQTRIVGGGTQNTNLPNYAVSRDGRFLVNQLQQESTVKAITLILNWSADGRK